RSPFLSHRAEIWRNTDPDRCGLLHEVFREGYGFEEYAKMAWERPLMFVENAEGKHIPAQGRSLQQIAEGAIPSVPISENNFRSCLSQLFFEARLKTGYLEVRSVDGLAGAERLAAAAFWTGL